MSNSLISFSDQCERSYLARIVPWVKRNLGKEFIQSASPKEAMPRGTWGSYWEGCSSRSQDDNVRSLMRVRSLKQLSQPVNRFANVVYHECRTTEYTRGIRVCACDTITYIDKLQVIGRLRENYDILPKYSDWQSKIYLNTEIYLKIFIARSRWNNHKKTSEFLARYMLSIAAC